MGESGVHQEVEGVRCSPPWDSWPCQREGNQPSESSETLARRDSRPSVRANPPGFRGLGSGVGGRRRGWPD